jgi:hypothetical protein
MGIDRILNQLLGCTMFFWKASTLSKHIATTIRYTIMDDTSNETRALQLQLLCSLFFCYSGLTHRFLEVKTSHFAFLVFFMIFNCTDILTR